MRAILVGVMVQQALQDAMVEQMMPVAVKAQAILAIPTESISWLISARCPVREAIDFDITVFSSEARKAMARATLIRVEIS